MPNATAIAEVARPTIQGDPGKLYKGKQLIVEFVGLPGSGKTTNCACFSQLLKRNRLSVYEFADVKSYLLQLQLHHRLKLYLRALFSDWPSIVSYTSLLIYHGIISFDSTWRYVKLCIFNNAAHEFMNSRKVDILLLDQGSIQGLWSATIFKTRPDSKLLTQLKEYYFHPHYAIYFDIDEETASQRIRERQSHKSRFDHMDDQRRLTALKQYREHLDNMYENSDCGNKIRFSTKASPLMNAQDFYRRLEENLRTKQ